LHCFTKLYLFIWENFQNLCQKHKRALLIRHQSPAEEKVKLFHEGNNFSVRSVWKYFHSFNIYYTPKSFHLSEKWEFKKGSYFFLFIILSKLAMITFRRQYLVSSNVSLSAQVIFFGPFLRLGVWNVIWHCINALINFFKKWSIFV
jgi:hypothetical protein